MIRQSQSIVLSALVVFSILTGCAKKSVPVGTPFKLYGRVLDQYDNPVVNAPIYIGLLSTEHPDGTVRAYTNSHGEFVYDSTPETVTAVEVSTKTFWADTGVLYDATRGKNGRFFLRPDDGWYVETTDYDRSTLPHDELAHPGPLSPETLVTFRVSHSGGPQPMAAFRSRLEPDTEGQTNYGIDLLTGNVRPLPCPQCDLLIKFNGCSSPEQNGKVEFTAIGGGIMEWPEDSDLEHNQNEAPEGGYLPSVSHSMIDGRLYTGKVLYFRVHTSKIYGRIYYDIQCAGKDKRGIDRSNSGTYGTLHIAYNPRGERNLNMGNIQYKPEPIKLPLAESQLPYKDEWHFDFSKIEVSENKTKSEVTVRGLPGASRLPCTKLGIDGV